MESKGSGCNDSRLSDLLAEAFAGNPRAVCRSMVDISAGFGATLIAQGIETFSQADRLAWLGCRLGQGHLYGVPLRLHGSAIAYHKCR
jgi:EAL domain-containing protein (putative c-di-GMP-specific phosphodiesterase class I)